MENQMPTPQPKKKVAKKKTAKKVEKKVTGYVRRNHQIKLSSDAATKLKSLFINSEHKNINSLLNEIILKQK